MLGEWLCSDNRAGRSPRVPTQGEECGKNRGMKERSIVINWNEQDCCWRGRSGDAFCTELAANHSASRSGVCFFSWIFFGK